MRRAALALAALVLIGTSAACSPKGNVCYQEGSTQYSSQYGEFVCKNGKWVEL